jgi:hypothetical protein
VTTDAGQQVACRRCGSLLNRSLDLDTGQARFTHPAQQRPADHQPDPVPADQIDAVYACDFCSDPHIVYTFRTSQPIQTVVVASGDQLIQDYGTEWSACLDCADLVQARDLNGLVHRIKRVGLPFDQEVTDRLHAMLAAVLATLRPGRALAAIGRWQPAPLPVAILPKVRDRLARLIRGQDDLPFDLNHAPIRADLAAGLDAARLYLDRRRVHRPRPARRRIAATHTVHQCGRGRPVRPSRLGPTRRPPHRRGRRLLELRPGRHPHRRLPQHRRRPAPDRPATAPGTGRLAGTPPHDHAAIKRGHLRRKPGQHAYRGMAAHRSEARGNHAGRGRPVHPQGVPACGQTGTGRAARPHPRHCTHRRAARRTAGRRKG